MNEDMTILLAKQGSEKAFRRLYDDHKERIYRLAYRYTRTMEDAEDIMQETFIRGFKKIHTFRHSSGDAFTAWLNRICINLAINHYRKMKRSKREQTVSISEMVSEPESKMNSPETTVQIKDHLDYLHRAVEKLTPKQRIIFDLRFSQHREIREIAGLMTCSESNIKTQLWRSVAKLRKQLKPILGEV